MSLSLVRCVTSEFGVCAVDEESEGAGGSVRSVGCLGGGGGPLELSVSGGPFSGSPALSSRFTPCTLSSSWQQSMTVLANSLPLQGKQNVKWIAKIIIFCWLM